MNYKKITDEDLTFFKSVCGEKAVLTGEHINEDFSHDELSGAKHYPEVVLSVENTEQISKIMKYASQELVPVTPRGQGTGLVGGCVALYGGVLLDMGKMNRILELDEENLILTVESGAVLMDISKYAEDHGYFYPPDPGEKSATIGGNINTICLTLVTCDMLRNSAISAPT